MLDKIRFKTEQSINIKTVNTVFAICIIAVCLLGSLPYIVTGSVDNFGDALFESISSLTTTGASTIGDFTTLSDGMKLYRAAFEWFGGAISIVVLATALKSFSYDDDSLGKYSNGSNLYRTGIRFSSIIKRLLFTYVVMTMLCTLILWIMGNKPGNALILAFSCVSTGGFPLYAVDGGSENAILTVLLVFMLFTCINYTVYYHLIKKHFAKVMNSTELFGFLVMIVLGCTVVVSGLYFSGKYDLQKSVFYGIFESISYASTSGFNIVSVFSWPAVSRITLVIMSLIGGCTASLASGIKLMRFIVLIKLVAQGFITRIHPAAVVGIKYNGKRVSGSVVRSVFSYILLFVAVYVLATFAFSFECGSLEESLIVTNSMITNLGGISVGLFGTFSKVVMCIVMLLGRFEFYVFMIPFAKKEK